MRLTVRDGSITGVTSSSGSSYDSLSGAGLADLFPIPIPEDRFVLLETDLGFGPIVAAARADGRESIVVYLLEGGCADGMNPLLPMMRLRQEEDVHPVTPGLVALLGYTPWELSGSGFFESLPDMEGSGSVSLMGRDGSARRLVCARLRGGGCDDIVLLPEPPDEESLPVRDLQRLASLEVEGAEDLLGFAADALGLDAAVLMVRSVDGFVVGCQYGMDLDPEILESSGLMEEERLQHPVWVSPPAGAGGDDVDIGQCMVYPCGDIVLVAPWRGEAERLQRRADALVPVLAVRYAHFASTRGDHRISTLLRELDRMLSAGDGRLDRVRLERALETAVRGFSATVMAVFGPEESASPMATSRISREMEELLVSDRPFEECFDDTHVAVLGEGFTLLTAWEGEHDVPCSAVEAFARMLRRTELSELGSMPPGPPDIQRLEAVLMRDTKVVWRGRTPPLDFCYQFYGRSVRCPDCPAARLAPGGSSARLEGHSGYIEEIHPTEQGHLVVWTAMPSVSVSMDAEDADEEPRRPGYPGGSAAYGPEGLVISWNGWMADVTGIPPGKAMGQRGTRLLDRLGNPVLTAQLRHALAGRLTPEPVELLLRGRTMLSSMRLDRSSGRVEHTLLDPARTGAAETTPPLLPGTIDDSGEPGSLAEYLSVVCRRAGWEFDVSVEASLGAPVWLTRRAATGLVSSLLATLEPMCPDRWIGLDSGWLDNSPETGGLTFLPGRYHVLRVRVQAPGFRARSAALEMTGRQVRSYGGWLAGSPGEEVVQIGIPAALAGFRERDLLVYSPEPGFAGLCRRAVDGTRGLDVSFAATALDLAEGQPTAGALVCRLDGSTLHFATTLAVRMPGQRILVASGLFSGLPAGVPRVSHLRLPEEEEDVMTAIRRLARG